MPGVAASRNMSIDTLIDTHHGTCQDSVVDRLKRTYNLPARTVQLVRELASDYRLAPTQDAVVELAVDELARQVREAQEAETWAKAAADPGFMDEAAGIEREFRTADRETWPPQ